MNTVVHFIINVHEVVIGSGKDLTFEPTGNKAVAEHSVLVAGAFEEFVGGNDG